jgi:hypothetical protein
MSATEIKNAAELCAFIRANRDSPELIERALSNPGVLAKIESGYLKDVIEELNGVSRSDLIPRVLTDEILAKIKCVFELKGVIGALNGASRSDLIPRVLTDEILAKIQAKIQNGYQLGWIINAVGWANPQLIPELLTAEILAKIENGYQLGWIINGVGWANPHLIPELLTAEILAKIANGYQLDDVIEKLKDASHIAIVLASGVIREKFSEVCDPGFANTLNDNPDLKALVVDAFQINTRWSPLRRAWVGVVVQSTNLTAATAVMGAGATAGGAGASAAATDPAPAPGSPDGTP